jgi:hypothetical protein
VVAGGGGGGRGQIRFWPDSDFKTKKSVLLLGIVVDRNRFDADQDKDKIFVLMPIQIRIRIRIRIDTKTMMIPMRILTQVLHMLEKRGKCGSFPFVDDSTNYL